MSQKHFVAGFARGISQEMAKEAAKDTEKKRRPSWMPLALGAAGGAAVGAAIVSGTQVDPLAGQVASGYVKDIMSKPKAKREAAARNVLRSFREQSPVGRVFRKMILPLIPRLARKG